MHPTEQYFHYEVTLLDPTIKPSILAKWLGENLGDNLKPLDLLKYAREMINGTPLKVPYIDRTTTCSFCSIELVDPEAERNRAYLEQQMQYHKWLTDGANGDAASAIAYCKAIAAGEISFMPRAMAF